MAFYVPPTCTTVLFDIDDTLMDHRSAAQRAAIAWLRQYPDYAGCSDQELIDVWMEQERRHYQRFERGEISHTEQRCERMRALLPDGPDLSPEELLAHFADFFDRYVSNWSPLPGAVEVVHRLEASGLRVGYLTNGSLSQQLDKVETLGLGRHRPLFAVSHLVAGKPDRRAFEAACAGMGTDATEVLMVGDNPVSDYEAALAAGLAAVLAGSAHHSSFTEGSPPAEALAKAQQRGHFVHNLAELQPRSSVS